MTITMPTAQNKVGGVFCKVCEQVVEACAYCLEVPRKSVYFALDNFAQHIAYVFHKLGIGGHVLQSVEERDYDCGAQPNGDCKYNEVIYQQFEGNAEVIYKDVYRVFEFHIFPFECAAAIIYARLQKYPARRAVCIIKRRAFSAANLFLAVCNPIRAQ